MQTPEREDTPALQEHENMLPAIQGAISGNTQIVEDEIQPDNEIQPTIEAEPLAAIEAGNHGDEVAALVPELANEFLPMDHVNDGDVDEEMVEAWTAPDILELYFWGDKEQLNELDEYVRIRFAPRGSRYGDLQQ